MSKQPLDQLAVIIQAAVDRYMEMDHIPIASRSSMYPHSIEDYVVIMEKIIDGADLFNEGNTKYYNFAINVATSLLFIES